MHFDHDAFIEAEIQRAPRTLSEHLFHYTSSESAIFGILASKTLRLSPFESTNDLWESRPTYPGLQQHHDDTDFDATFPIWQAIDRHIRLHAKVACLTQDWNLPDDVMDRDVFRGWAHLSLWAHYGAAHTGLCLRFDRHELTKQLIEQTSASGQSFHGPVKYVGHSVGAVAEGIDIGQIKQFGVDAVAAIYAEENNEAVFFRKHADWSNETEYRLVHVNQSVLPTQIDISTSLSGVYVGESFSNSRIPALMAVMKKFPNAEMFKLASHNRALRPWPWQEHMASVADEGAEAALPDPAQSGSLEERTARLRQSISEAIAAKEQARVLADPLLQTMSQWAWSFQERATGWPSSICQITDSAGAVPVPMRQRAPGVPGERVHFEGGFSCIVEHQPAYSHTFVASIAIQVLDDLQCRFHAVVSLEDWLPSGNVQQDFWREDLVSTLAGAGQAMQRMIESLTLAADRGRVQFDRRRTGA